ncbi:polymer-forming cytoskeletal protein [Paenibacillus sp. ClWae2A]|uniref:polymer-forming cytoskeletal protein n=1 Tax=Paenibacillus sp. ClWae2A TaxID=3057177 RepID=UPI0028F5567E|nr:polymer-forming cytoskeletal protein [Paenibacillus sp. ClWae2A]MDT9720485.1 polymer-forming cytoskeletal protein [Paenibacillus sp. ClWae2A]
MFPISPLYKDYLRRPDREFIVKALVGSEEYDSSRIVDFSIENSLSLTEGFEIGTSIPSKLTIKLRTNEIIPANARIVPYLSLSLAGLTWLEAQYPWKDMNLTWTGSGTDWLPLGEFFVDDREKINDVWTFTCYDKLVMADVAYISSLTYPTTQKAVFDEICKRLGWTYDSSVVINSAYRIQAGPAGYTMRQVLAYIASANSASIYIDKAGTLKFKRFTASENPVFDMTTADYVTVKQTNPVKTYTRVVVTYNTEDGLQYEAGTGDENHTLYVENPFATQAVTNGLLSTLNGFSYLPLTMDARGYPQLEQGDVIGFEQQEGTTWDETVSTWQDTNIPWDGVVRYKTIILHQVFSFAGGLKMSLEAPSVSEQRSEFIVEGSLTQQVNKLNKDAIKEGKSYYGATITRTEGLIIEREDHRSKAVFNSDELTFYRGSDKALWFDLPSNRYKFNGTLEAVDGVFSGNLSAAGGTFAGTLQGVDGTFTGNLSAAGGTFKGNLSAAGGTFTGTLVGVDGTFSGTLQAATINGGTINGSTIIGSVLKTANSGRRIEIDSGGFRSYDSNGRNRVQIATTDDASAAAVIWRDSNGTAVGEINSYQSSGVLTMYGNNITIGSNNTGNPIRMQGAVTFGGAINGLDISDVNGLQSQLTSLQTQISNLLVTFYAHSHNFTLPTHNHGLANAANWGGTFTTSTP